MTNPRKRSVAAMEDMSSAHHHFDNSIPRSGKWTIEEETFANRLITEFESGALVDCEDGCTLRSYLARKLNCAPMRISKKFAGQCIGKHTFVKKEGFAHNSNGLHDLENNFRQTRKDSDSKGINGKKGTSSSGSTSDETSSERSKSYSTTVSFDSFAQYQQLQAGGGNGTMFYPPQAAAGVAAGAAAGSSVIRGTAGVPLGIAETKAYMLSSLRKQIHDTRDTTGGYMHDALLPNAAAASSMGVHGGSITAAGMGGPMGAAGLHSAAPATVGGHSMIMASGPLSGATSNPHASTCVGLDIDDMYQANYGGAMPSSSGSSSSFSSSSSSSVMGDSSCGTSSSSTGDEDNHNVVEAEEWKDVLSFFCGNPSVSAEQMDAGMNMVRRDSSFLVKTNSYSSLLL